MKKIETAKGRKVRAARYGRRGNAEDWIESLEEKYERKSAETKREETKTLRKEERQTSVSTEYGRVIAPAARAWIVLPDNALQMPVVECVAAGTVLSQHADSSLIAVGDRVEFIRNSDGGGSIVGVGERSTKLARRGIGKSAREQVIIANAEQLLIVMAAAEPFYNRRLIDRYLIAAEKGNLSPVICINKIELMPPEMIRDDLRVYKHLKIPIVFTSAATGGGIEELLAILKEKITVFSGPSGVGKSTLTNRILGREIQRTNTINEKFGKGKHVTTAAEIFPLPGGGFIADTPGLREFGLWDVSREEAQFYFHDFDRYFPKCKFNSCMHLHEPECAVRKAVEAGRIDPERYQSYVNIVGSLEE